MRFYIPVAIAEGDNKAEGGRGETETSKRSARESGSGKGGASCA